jgi:hypothetical protein
MEDLHLMTKEAKRMPKTVRFILFVVAALLVWPQVSCRSGGGTDYPFTAVPLTAVKLTDAFWAPRLETNRTVTIPFALEQCESTGRIKNFEIAGGSAQGSFCTKYPFDDSDVYKVIEGAAYSLLVHPDPELESRIDGIIAKIASAQEKDGYLYTARTIDPAKPPVDWVGAERWSNLYLSHELYNLGHLYEAAVAYNRATGKKNLLEVALKSANLLDSVFGPGKKHGTSAGRSDRPGQTLPADREEKIPQPGQVLPRREGKCQRPETLRRIFPGSPPRNRANRGCRSCGPGDVHV